MRGATSNLPLGIASSTRPRVSAAASSNGGATMVMPRGTVCVGPSTSVIFGFRKAGISRVRTSVKPDPGGRAYRRYPPASVLRSRQLLQRGIAARHRIQLGNVEFVGEVSVAHAQAGGGPGRVPPNGAFMLHASRESNPLMTASTWAHQPPRSRSGRSCPGTAQRHRPRPSATISRTRHACGTIVLRNRYWMASGRHGDRQKRRGR